MNLKDILNEALTKKAGKPTKVVKPTTSVEPVKTTKIAEPKKLDKLAKAKKLKDKEDTRKTTPDKLKETEGDRPYWGSYYDVHSKDPYWMNTDDKNIQKEAEGGESPADQAHKLNLTHAGYGYWKDKSGKTVAKTVKGNLTKLEPGEEVSHEKDATWTNKNPYTGNTDKNVQHKVRHPKDQSAISPTANAQGEEPDMGLASMVPGHVNPYDNGPDEPINQGVPYSPETGYDKEKLAAHKAEKMNRIVKNLKGMKGATRTAGYEIGEYVKDAMASKDANVQKAFDDWVDAGGAASDKSYDLGGGKTEDMPLEDNEDYQDAKNKFIDALENQEPPYPETPKQDWHNQMGDDEYHINPYDASHPGFDRLKQNGVEYAPGIGFHDPKTGAHVNPQDGGQDFLDYMKKSGADYAPGKGFYGKKESPSDTKLASMVPQSVNYDAANAEYEDAMSNLETAKAAYLASGSGEKSAEQQAYTAAFDRVRQAGDKLNSLEGGMASQVPSKNADDFKKSVKQLKNSPEFNKTPYAYTPGFNHLRNTVDNLEGAIPDEAYNTELGLERPEDVFETADKETLEAYVEFMKSVANYAEGNDDVQTDVDNFERPDIMSVPAIVKAKKNFEKIQAGQKQRTTGMASQVPSEYPEVPKQNWHNQMGDDEYHINPNDASHPGFERMTQNGVAYAPGIGFHDPKTGSHVNPNDDYEYMDFMKKSGASYAPGKGFYGKKEPSSDISAIAKDAAKQARQKHGVDAGSKLKNQYTGKPFDLGNDEDYIDPKTGKKYVDPYGTTTGDEEQGADDFEQGKTHHGPEDFGMASKTIRAEPDEFDDPEHDAEYEKGLAADDERYDDEGDYDIPVDDGDFYSDDDDTGMASERPNSPEKEAELEKSFDAPKQATSSKLKAAVPQDTGMASKNRYTHPKGEFNYDDPNGPAGYDAYKAREKASGGAELNAAKNKLAGLGDTGMASQTPSRAGISYPPEFQDARDKYTTAQRKYAELVNAGKRPMDATKSQSPEAKEVLATRKEFTDVAKKYQDNLRDTGMASWVPKEPTKYSPEFEARLKAELDKMRADGATPKQMSWHSIGAKAKEYNRMKAAKLGTTPSHLDMVKKLDAAKREREIRDAKNKPTDTGMASTRPAVSPENEKRYIKNFYDDLNSASARLAHLQNSDADPKEIARARKKQGIMQDALHRLVAAQNGVSEETPMDVLYSAYEQSEAPEDTGMASVVPNKSAKKGSPAKFVGVGRPASHESPEEGPDFEPLEPSSYDFTPDDEEWKSDASVIDDYMKNSMSVKKAARDFAFNYDGQYQDAAGAIDAHKKYAQEHGNTELVKYLTQMQDQLEKSAEEQAYADWEDYNSYRKGDFEESVKNEDKKMSNIKLSDCLPEAAKLGSGSRFKKVEKAAKKSGARNPAAVAAAAGRKKYGQKKMTALSQKGKRDAKK